MADRPGRPPKIRRRTGWAEWLKRAGSFSTSAFLHLLVLLALGEIVAVVVPVLEEKPLCIRIRPPAGVAGGPGFPSDTPKGDSAKKEDTGGAPPAPAETPATAVGTGTGRSAPLMVEPVENVQLLSSTDLRGLTTGPLFGDRSSGGRGAGVGRYGGDAASEAAVEAGLRWLASHQSSDGRWSPRAYPDACGHNTPCGLRDRLEKYTPGITGLCLLAFLGAGYTWEAGPHPQVVRRAVDWLLEHQDASGFFRGSSLYDHGVCTLALGEACAMTGDTRLLKPLERAVAAILATQREVGGWYYSPDLEPGRVEFTMSVWNMMALKAASLAGVHVSPETLDRCRVYVRSSTGEDGSVDYGRGSPTPGSTLAGLFARCILAIDDGDAFRKSLHWADQMPDPPLVGPHGWMGHYHWYYRTLVSFQIQGSRWRDWNGKFRNELVSMQRRKGHSAGSWELQDDQKMGPLYATAMSVLMLEVYYRYLPLHSSGTLLGTIADTTDSERTRERAAQEVVASSSLKRLDHLREKLRSVKPEDRYLATRELASMREPSLIREMIQAAEEERGPLRPAYVRMIGQVRCQEAAPFLIREYSSPREDVRAAALTALHQVTGQAFAEPAQWKSWLEERTGRTRPEK
jgi:hypothetical protein